jgi:F-type H+-transporting ATPase subunit epsilon
MSEFHFELVSPERLLISGNAEQVIVPGSEGYFTVLPNHAPVLTSLRPGVIESRMASGAVQRLYVHGGFAEVSPTSLTILAQSAVDLKTMDKDWATRALADAETAKSTATTDEDQYLAQAAVEALRSLV